MDSNRSLIIILIIIVIIMMFIYAWKNSKSFGKYADTENIAYIKKSS